MHRKKKKGAGSAERATRCQATLTRGNAATRQTATLNAAGVTLRRTTSVMQGNVTRNVATLLFFYANANAAKQGYNCIQKGNAAIN